jgi:hypothetical protein
MAVVAKSSTKVFLETSTHDKQNFKMTKKQTTGGLTMGIRQQTQQERQKRVRVIKPSKYLSCCGGVGF